MINVIGLGYIGLPTALMLASHGVDVVGTDYNHELVATLNAGKTTFEEAGLDVEKLKKDMENPAVEEEIIRTRELATKLGIQGTPAFIIGDQFFRGFIEAPAMMEAIKQSK